MTQEAFADKRLLGALDYIDERFIAEVTEDYESFEVPGVYKPNKRAHRRAYRQFAAMAACLILLTSAFPVVGKYLAGKGVNLGGWGGNAGAGTSEIEMPTPTETQALNTEPEMTQVLETEPAETQAAVIDSGFDKALERYADMSAEEIYADVLKGGWVVKGPGYLGDLEAGKDLLDNFFTKTQNGEPATVLYANYYTVNGNAIYLYEVVYNGDKFYFNLFNCQTDVIDFQGEYEYLKKGIVEYTELGELYVKEGYFLTNRDSVTWDMLYNSHLNAWYAPEYERCNDINYVIIEIVNKK